jgi:hypothetical protein
VTDAHKQDAELIAAEVERRFASARRNASRTSFVDPGAGYGGSLA